MFFKAIFKCYEFWLRKTRFIPISYFIDRFESQPIITIPQSQAASTLHIYIPFRDRAELTIECLRSVFRQRASNLHLSLHLIDNGSRSESLALLDEFLHKEAPVQATVETHRIDTPFNFSALCNLALRYPGSVGPVDYFLFLNNDIILQDHSSFELMIPFVGRNPDCGAVGITLLYPNHRIQHIFAAPGVKIIAAHPFKGFDADYLKDWKQAARRVPAVTGACMLMPATAFHKAGGFDENLPTAGQDIDLCLKLQSLGYKNWVLPTIEALHLESASRRHAKIPRAEVDYIYKKWGETLTQNRDYPLTISRWSEQPAFRLFDRKYPYRLALCSND